MLASKRPVKLLFYYFLWLTGIYLILYFSTAIVPIKFGFLGGKLSQYLNTPQLWAFINFDGKHYLSIAARGYKDLQHFYFPLYILLIKTFASVLSIKLPIAGILVSRTAFFIALWGLFKLVLIDHEEKIAYRTIFLLFLFPTSFYFASFYTEAAFLLLVVWSFYFARNKKWLFVGVLGALSTATRIVGLALIPALIVELYLQRNELDTRQKKLAVISIFLIPAGLLAYMYYMWQTTGDPLVFYNKLHIFGQQRSTRLVLLPQVFYRYFFKILPNINYSYFPLLFVTLLEAAVGVGFTILLVYSKVKIRVSYTVYFLVAFLIPTLSGSFSSLPRYVLVIFPAFLLASLILDKISRVGRLVVFAILLILLAVSASLFFRGYWIA